MAFHAKKVILSTIRNIDGCITKNRLFEASKKAAGPHRITRTKFDKLFDQLRNEGYIARRSSSFTYQEPVIEAAAA